MSFPANYNTMCPACGEWIDAGDEITRSDDGYVHEECR